MEDPNKESRAIMAALRGKGHSQGDTPAADLHRILATIQHPDVRAAIHAAIADPAAFDAAVENVHPVTTIVLEGIASEMWQAVDVDLGFAADPTGTQRRPA